MHFEQKKKYWKVLVEAILGVVCCVCRTEAARSATVTGCSCLLPTASCFWSPLNGRWLSLVQCLPARPSCDTVSPVQCLEPSFCIPWFSLPLGPDIIHPNLWRNFCPIESPLLGLVSPVLHYSFPCVLWAQLLHSVIPLPLDICSFGNTLDSSLSNKSSSIAIIECFWSWIKISWSPCWFVVFKFGLNLVIYPGCCVPFSLALLCSTWYALTVKGRRWILWHSKREQKGAQLSPSWACTLHCKSGFKRRLTNLFAFAFPLLVHNKYSLILWTKLYLPFWCMALICPLLSKLDPNYTWNLNCAFDFTQILESCNSTIWL